MDILYVEDNLDEADVFSRVLKKTGREISLKILNSGQEAIHYLLGQGNYQGQMNPLPKLLLIDLNLPGQSGFDVVQLVRANNRTRCIPMVIYSTSDNPKDIRRAYELSANAYLVKPGSYRESGPMINRMLDFWLVDNARV